MEEEKKQKEMEDAEKSEHEEAEEEVVEGPLPEETKYLELRQKMADIIDEEKALTEDEQEILENLGRFIKQNRNLM